jgi:hypothetical protein
VAVEELDVLEEDVLLTFELLELDELVVDVVTRLLFVDAKYT